MLGLCFWHGLPLVMSAFHEYLDERDYSTRLPENFSLYGDEGTSCACAIVKGNDCRAYLLLDNINAHVTVGQ